MRSPLKWPWKYKVLWACLLVCSLYCAYRAYGIVRWKMYIWLPSYLLADTNVAEVPDSQRHLIFIMVDHFEPGGPDDHERGVRLTKQWIGWFRPVAGRHVDSYGNNFRYTWFYPYDHRNEGVLARLSEMAYEGYGEVELHWHHPPADNESFPSMLKEAIAWFQQYGALISSGSNPETHFAFIHGSWRLDNSTPDGKCGVNRELDILFQQGCYADFTFSTIATYAQPRKVNSIYYATDTDEPKSYDDGQDATVGKPVNDRLMIFEGPLDYSLLWGSVEYGAVEADPDLWPRPSRISRWIDANIHVKGRPEWVFVKVYSHGSQSKIIVRDHLDDMLSALEAICQTRGMRLHYMTAREAYNVVKAAEDGETGDPEEYRDYRIPKPRNMLFHTDLPVPIGRISETKTAYRALAERP